MTTKTKKHATKKIDATEKARKEAIATIEKRLAKKPDRTAKGTKAKVAKPGKETKARRTSALDAAAIVLAKAGKPMTSKSMIEAMASAGLWKSPGGKTPEATLYAAIIREIAKKGPGARFKKTDRGMFASTGKGA